MFKKYSYGTVIVSEREMDFLKIQFNSLKHFIDLDEVEIVVNTSLNRTTFPFKTDRVIYQKTLEKSRFEMGTGSGYAGQDCANRLDMIVREAHGDYVILTHSDIVWVGNILNGIKNEVSVNHAVGVIENWRWGVTVVSKEFYDQSPFGFFKIPTLSAFREYNGQLRIIPPTGPFSDKLDQSKIESVVGLDMGELLEIDCYNKGYKHVVFDDSNKYYRHTGEQSLSWVRDNLTEETKQSKLRDLDQRRASFFNEYWRFK